MRNSRGASGRGSAFITVQVEKVVGIGPLCRLVLKSNLRTALPPNMGLGQVQRCSGALWQVGGPEGLQPLRP